MWGQPPRLSAERNSAGFLQVPASPPFSVRTGGRHMKYQGGFTLLELMIVVVLILVIAAIAIPSMREAQIHANEASAVGSIRPSIRLKCNTRRPTEVMRSPYPTWVVSILAQSPPRQPVCSIKV